ncbi:MAG: PAS domain-containing protein [Alphaproteobacteria bacterium]|jgi:two-component system, NtrC family, nitrogen regulation sensor histidine kinase GlnL|nr:PAS domain-containing protein [Alphaproteobacteria bacterium]MBT4083898.1 PAS domain-containing protein [Alphaproteobacteria bacterium]MBT4546200.1 PAS domain-containing protein [Alphaproteobacteria bacterium]MBT7746533.1 PAS domain-containing protein [Alphaproteobacteria bacterium]
MSSNVTPIPVTDDEDLGTEAILFALPDPVMVLDDKGYVRFVNPATEQFFGAGRAYICSRTLSELVHFDSPLNALANQVREQQISVSEHGVELSTPRTGSQHVDMQGVPLSERPGWVLINLQRRSMAETMDRQLNHQGAARSVTGMAAVLAHEIKNPLSGIRGAAQLIEQNVRSDDRDLTRLICDETDRICAIVDEMDKFSDERALERGAVNIHEVLDHIRRLGENGFAKNMRFVARYDPSLPPVLGNRDKLLQALLNLVKNAAEAIGNEGGGEITLGTAYRQGVRVAVPGSRDRVNLPLEVSIQDNGKGISEELRQHLFEAFVTNKPGGTGLGLPLVAKTVRDHGGIIEFETQPKKTVFRIRLPMCPPGTPFDAVDEELT